MQTNFEDVTFTKQSNLWTDAGEDKLKQVQYTGASVGPAQVLENQIRAEISRLQLSPDGKCENYSRFLLFRGVNIKWCRFQSGTKYL